MNDEEKNHQLIIEYFNDHNLGNKEDNELIEEDSISYFLEGLSRLGPNSNKPQHTYLKKENFYSSIYHELSHYQYDEITPEICTTVFLSCFHKAPPSPESLSPIVFYRSPDDWHIHKFIGDNYYGKNEGPGIYEYLSINTIDKRRLISDFIENNTYSGVSDYGKFEYLHLSEAEKILRQYLMFEMEHKNNLNQRLNKIEAKAAALDLMERMGRNSSYFSNATSLEQTFNNPVRKFFDMENRCAIESTFTICAYNEKQILWLEQNWDIECET